MLPILLWDFAWLPQGQGQRQFYQAYPLHTPEMLANFRWDVPTGKGDVALGIWGCGNLGN